MRLSYSKLSRYERCPLSYKFYYLDRLPSEPSIHLLFGSAVHEVLEKLVQEHVDGERVGPLSKTRAEELWQLVWKETEMSGVEVYQEGLDILTQFVRQHTHLDHLDILAVEQPFSFTLPGDLQVIGYIDRIDRIDDETIEVIDYKTSRQLYMSYEVDKSLQLSLYQIAAQQLWPWAKKVRLSYWMLRHDLRQSTERRPNELEGVKKYVATLGEQIRDAQEFTPKLNTYCGSCDYRKKCPKYQEVLSGEVTPLGHDFGDLELAARELETTTDRLKILNGRKKELEKPLRAALRDQEEIVLGQIRYVLQKTSRTKYSVIKTLKVIEQAGLCPDTFLEQVLKVDSKSLREFLRCHFPENPSRARMVEAELDALADHTYSTRISATSVMP